MSNIIVHNRTYLGVASLAIRRLSDGVVYNFPPPVDFVLQTNVQERQQMGRNALGRMIRINSYVASEMPILQVQYGQLTPELISFKTGLQLESLPASVNLSTHFPKVLQITKGEYTAAEIGLTSSTAGTTIAVNPVDTFASITENGVSRLIQQSTTAYGSFPDTGDGDKFVCNASGNFKFGQNLVNAQSVVTLYVAITTNKGARLSSQIIGNVAIKAALINTLNKVDILDIPLATPALENSTIQFGAEGIDMTFYLNNLPGTCSSWNLYQTELTVSC